MDKAREEHYDKKFVENIEEIVKKDLTRFLINKGALDTHVPQCPDVEEKFEEIGHSYLEDGVREFQEFPVTSLGWMMFMGMAMAYYWDTDWEKYANKKNYYTSLRDENGYDNLDETVVEKLLGYEGEAAQKVMELVAECASRTLSVLQHSNIEAGTRLAFSCYIACLRQLYLAGMAMELNALGYHMTPLTAGNPSMN